MQVYQPQVKVQSQQVEAGKLVEGQVIRLAGRELRVRRVLAAFTRSSGCHVHLVPMDWQPLIGVAQKLAQAHECEALVRVSCPTFRQFEVVSDECGSGR